MAARQELCKNGLRLNHHKPLTYLARPAGIEPATPWFVAKYSIQLSYGRMKRNYSNPCQVKKQNGKRVPRTLLNQQQKLHGIFAFAGNAQKFVVRI